MNEGISAEEWSRYERDGYLKLGRLLSERDLSALQRRMDDIMMGKATLNYEALLMQLDSGTGQYGDLAAQTHGFKGPTLDYRKIENLEMDPLFLEYMRRPLFRDICAHVYGADTSIASFRAMFMNKPARKGTLLPWHQDRWTALDRDPLITIWTALDPATIANGCVQAIPGSHKLGVINPSHHSAFLTEEQAGTHAPDEKIIWLELAAGEVILLHNWLLHRSDVNKTDIARRGFSVSYMDARTRSSNGRQFPVIFGSAASCDEDLRKAAV